MTKVWLQIYCVTKEFVSIFQWAADFVCYHAEECAENDTRPVFVLGSSLVDCCGKPRVVTARDLTTQNCSACGELQLVHVFATKCGAKVNMNTHALFLCWHRSTNIHTADTRVYCCLSSQSNCLGNRSHWVYSHHMAGKWNQHAQF